MREEGRWMVAGNRRPSAWHILPRVLASWPEPGPHPPPVPAAANAGALL